MLIQWVKQNRDPPNAYQQGTRMKLTKGRNFMGVSATQRTDKIKNTSVQQYRLERLGGLKVL